MLLRRVLESERDSSQSGSPSPGPLVSLDVSVARLASRGPLPTSPLSLTWTALGDMEPFQQNRGSPISLQRRQNGPAMEGRVGVVESVEAAGWVLANVWPSQLYVLCLCQFSPPTTFPFYFLKGETVLWK